jgi:hypothetical protein
MVKRVGLHYHGLIPTVFVWFGTVLKIGRTVPVYTSSHVTGEDGIGKDGWLAGWLTITSGR